MFIILLTGIPGYVGIVLAFIVGRIPSQGPPNVHSPIFLRDPIYRVTKDKSNTRNSVKHLTLSPKTLYVSRKTHSPIDSI